MFGIAFVVITLSAGVVLAITFFGLGLMALSVRGARGFGGLHRQLARTYLGEHLDDPEEFSSRPGFLGWLQSSLRDRTGWRSMAYMGLKVPLATLGILAGFAFWWDAFFCLTFPLWGGSGNSPAVYGLPQLLFGNDFFSGGHTGFLYGVGVFLAGVVFFFAAPWAVRARRLPRPPGVASPPGARSRGAAGAFARAGPSPDGRRFGGDAAADRAGPPRRHPGAARGASHATRHGEGEAGGQEGVDIEQVRALVDDAHRGAKEAITELRDLARGIHPPALDIGLEGALSTLAARTTVPTELSGSPIDRHRPSRPSPISASRSFSPTSPNTPTPRGPRSPVPSTGVGCVWWCATTERAGHGRRARGPRRVG